MSTRKKLLGGRRKTSAQHTTLIPPVSKLLSKIQNLPGIEKIQPGPVAHIGSGEKRLRMQHVTAGLQLIIFGEGAKQLVFIKTGSSEDLAVGIKAVWDKKVK